MYTSVELKIKSSRSKYTKYFIIEMHTENIYQNIKTIPITFLIYKEFIFSDLVTWMKGVSSKFASNLRKLFVVNGILIHLEFLVSC